MYGNRRRRFLDMSYGLYAKRSAKIDTYLVRVFLDTWYLGEIESDSQNVWTCMYTIFARVSACNFPQACSVGYSQIGTGGILLL